MFLLAQWLVHWCAGRVAQVRFLAYLVMSKLLQGENTSATVNIHYFLIEHAHNALIMGNYFVWLLYVFQTNSKEQKTPRDILQRVL